MTVDPWMAQLDRLRAAGLTDHEVAALISDAVAKGQHRLDLEVALREKAKAIGAAGYAEGLQDGRMERDAAIAREKALLTVDPFDDVTGTCLWCAGGWEQVRGPRGGKGKHMHTGKHRDGCAFAASLDAHDASLVNLTSSEEAR